MSISNVSKVTYGDILDCIPAVSTLYNLFDAALACVGYGSKGKTLASRLVYAVPVIGNICKIVQICQKRLIASSDEGLNLLTVSYLESSSLQASSHLVSFTPGLFVKEPKDLGEFVGANIGSSKGFEFTKGLPASNAIEAFRSGVSGLCDRVVVKGDGHCLFRAFAYQLLLQARGDGSLQAKLLLALDRFMASFRASSVDKVSLGLDVEGSLALIKRDIAAGVDPYRLLNNLDRSNSLVKALRIVTSAFNLMQTSKADMEFALLIEENLENAEKGDFTGYLRSMSSCEENKTGKFATSLEIRALSRLFGVDAVVFSFDPYMAPKTVFKSGTLSAQKMAFYFRQSHYDALLVDSNFLTAQLA